MTFYVSKSLAHGGIRFGVSPRHTVDQIDTEARLSTGPAGEYLRGRGSSFFFADTRPIGSPHLVSTPSISSTPFLSSLKPADRKGWLLIGLMILGVIFVLLGFSVVLTKGPQGWVEVVLGMGMIATPLVMTAQKRRQLRLQEEKERAEREERERRQREMLGSYGTALEALRRDPNDETLQTVTAERERLELPYDMWSEIARRSVLDIGFKRLGKPELPTLISRAANAVGLSIEDEQRVKRALYETVLWHFLAADRLGDVQEKQLASIGSALGIPEPNAYAEEFKRLRGISRENLPRVDCPIPLGFHEYCIHMTRGADCAVYVTNKRIIIDTAKKRTEVALTQIDDVELNVDANQLTITIARPNKPIHLQLEQPIYTAALIDLATTIDERPRSFA